jgi:ligand-binding sensor domain-containing protein
VAVWGGGILEWDVKLKRWKAHIDPDGEMEIDLFRDDGLIHIITTGVAYESGILWASTYFGLSRYDGRHWRGYMEHESGLASDFINFVNARGKEAWVCTDQGLSHLVHFETDTWVNYKKNEADENGVAIVSRGMEVLKTIPTRGASPHKFVLCVDFQGDDVWVGTSSGLARGAGKGRWPGLKEVQPRTPDPEPQTPKE